MSNMGLKIGDVVRLASGGPAMTITEIELPSFFGYQTAQALCTYIDGCSKVRYARFALQLLDGCHPSWQPTEIK